MSLSAVVRGKCEYVCLAFSWFFWPATHLHPLVSGQSGIAGQTRPRVSPQTLNVALNLGIASSWRSLLIGKFLVYYADWKSFHERAARSLPRVLNLLFHLFFALSWSMHASNLTFFSSVHCIAINALLHSHKCLFYLFDPSFCFV